MLFLFVFTLVVAAVCAVTVWSRVCREPAAARPWRDAVGAGPESPEGVLAAQLAAGDLTHRQYVQAMERMAANDDDRNPLAVPPVSGPPAS